MADGRAVTLMLGNQHFLQRFQNYLDNRVEISKRMPNATVLDLRLRDRITAVDSTSENASDSKGSRNEQRPLCGWTGRWQLAHTVCGLSS